MDLAVNLLESLLRKGVRLWSTNGKLHYNAPKGILAPDEISELKRHKAQIVSLLERVTYTVDTEPLPTKSARVGRAPVTFAQMAHWSFFELGTLPSSHIVPMAIRVHGNLDVGVLRQAFAAIAPRHDALWTQIVSCDGVPIQQVSTPGVFDLEVKDLTALSEEFRRSEIDRLLDQHTYGPIKIALEPLFRAQLLIVKPHEHVLLMSMEHIVSDGVSMRILLHEVLQAYLQLMRGVALSLPEVPIQFTDYAVWQRNSHEIWLARHGPYWEEHLKGARRLRFPSDQNLQSESQLGWGAVPLHITKALTMQMHQWCRGKGTTLVMGVFVAYVALVLRWCESLEGIFLKVIDGRTDPTLQHTIGYFAFPLYLRLRISECETFAELLHRVTREYCNAYEHADYCYMASQSPRPDFTQNSLFNWMGRDLANDSIDLGPALLELCPMEIPLESKVVKGREVDAEPCVIAFESDEGIRGWVTFPIRRFSAAKMGVFARNLPVFVEAMLREPSQRISEVLLL